MSNSEIFKQWPDVFASYANAFDTPQNRALVKGPLAVAARKTMQDFNEALLALDKDEKRDSEVLGAAIADAALKAGIYNGEVVLTAAHLVLLAEGLAETIKGCLKGWIAIADRLPAPYKNVGVGTPGKITRIAWIHEDGRWETDQGGFTEMPETHWYDTEEETAAVEAEAPAA